jgi:hypothetical protein
MKKNLLISGAIIGGALSFLIMLLFKRDKPNEILLEDKKESNNARAEKDKEVLSLTDKYSEDLEKARVAAQKAGQELTLQQEEKLAERLEAYSSAESADDREEIRKDIGKVFPWMKMVKPTEFGVIE